MRFLPTGENKLTMPRSALVNYNHRRRKEMPVSTSRTEGLVSDIANTRMGKDQRVEWSPRGAQCVAVVRTAVLYGRLTAGETMAA